MQSPQACCLWLEGAVMPLLRLSVMRYWLKTYAC